MAKFKYDIELLLSDLEALFKSKLNDKITAVNLEKNTLTDETNDNFNISSINNNAWYFHQLPSTWSYEEFVVFGLQDISIEDGMPLGQIQKVSIFFEVAIVDAGENENESQIFKLLRYTRCLQEVATENFDKLRGYSNLTVDSLPPTLIEFSGKKLKTAGIIISASIDV